MTGISNPYPPTVWRLLLQPQPGDGAINMAWDEVLLQAVREKLSPPTLRLYAWTPTLSLGRGQPFAHVDLDALYRGGYGLVRRPSGGQAVLTTHNGDQLSYAVAGPDDEPRFSGGILATYRHLSAGLLAALERLGVSARAVEAAAPAPSHAPPVCFAATSTYEITAQGRKIAGHAQLRRAHAVLQHGTLLLDGDIARICPLLRPPTDPEQLRTRTTHLRQELGRPVPWEEAAAAVLDGFRRALNVTLEPGDWLPQERAWAEALYREKYTHPTWTAKV